jgi:DNA-binding beta-propeller fold protein YncE
MDPQNVFKIKTINNVTVANKPISIDVNPNTNGVYVTNGTGMVYMINGFTNKIIDNITLDTNTNELFINPVNNNLHIIDSFDDTIFSVNTSKNAIAIHMDNRSFTMAIDPSNNILYVLSYFSDTVSMINGTNNVPIFGITFKINSEGLGNTNNEIK